ncbi:serine/threonine protein kinase [Streptomyces huiliensis]|uniref:serine/threonine protein kinase n=1 Tax=Streptomyces huiliensis TaxID=2876027 RepID=UPI001CBB818F|nr:serine/threonine-protein kinase [Streptomyces huiliensis]MBZ4319105.1 serine/threonine protein kinase [Streptomyces huiliensis]
MEPLRPHDPPAIGPHTLLARLGSGGMGQVYLGRSPGGRQLAIKVIREDFAQSGEASARFRREVATVGAVRSAYTANLVDASLETVPYWLATEYVPGPTLTRATGERGPLPPETCFRLFAALAEALAQVHGHGITHRDLKPHNIILSPVGPKLIDFGIARGAEQTALTRTGIAPGTPGYTAPEVITRNEVSFAADVFALGATMACAATGRPPYGEGSLESVVYRVVHGEVDAAGLEPRLADLVRACTAADPAARPALSEVIERCAVRSSLVDDPVYRAVAALGESAPEDVPAALAAGLIPERPLGAAGAPGGAYTPTYVPPQPAGPPRRPRRWSAYAAAAVASAVVGGVAAYGVLRPDGGDDGKEPEVVAQGTGRATPGVSGGGGPKVPPAYVEQADSYRGSWQHKEGGLSFEGQCTEPPEEGLDNLQTSISDPQNPDGDTPPGKVRIGFRLKYLIGKFEKPYYVSVAVKSPHWIDEETGKPNPHQGNIGNLDLGYTSKPVNLFGDDPQKWVYLTFPDDFGRTVRGKTEATRVPVTNDPGGWTVNFLHVRGPQQYKSFACGGFLVE